MPTFRVSQGFAEVLHATDDNPRVSQAFAEALYQDNDHIRVSQAFAEVVCLDIYLPTTPTITVDAYDQISVDLRSSAFVAGEGGTHEASRWQITTAADTGFAAPVHDSGETTVFKTAYSYSGLLGGTAYIARLAHKESNGYWSGWSNPASFTTLDVPDKPTISIAATAADYVQFASSAFSSSTPGAAHAASQWQLADSADTGFASPLADVTVYQGDLLSWAFFGLDLWANQYIGRVRHRDEEDAWSPWSDPSAATTLIAEGQFYTAMAERPVGVDIVDDTLADWDEYADADESDWPITVRDDATCKVVAARSSVDGDADTVDPAWSNALPDVDEQIVWVKLIFDHAGTGGACPPGSIDQSPGGLICRTHSGRLNSYCLGDPADWEIHNEGPGEAWEWTPAGGPNGCGSIRYLRQVGGTGGAWAKFTGGGLRPAGEFAQFRTKRYFTDGVDCLEREPYLQGGAWPGFLFCLDPEDDGYLFDNPFVSWFYWFKHRLSQFIGGARAAELSQAGSLQFALGACGWDFARVGWDADYQHYSAAQESGAGSAFMEHEFDDGTRDVGYLGVYLEGKDDERVDVDEAMYLEWADLETCEANRLRFYNMKPWHAIDVAPLAAGVGGSGLFDDPTDSGVYWGRRFIASSGVSEAFYNFHADAWPASRIRLWDTRTWTLIDEWTTEMWGGDEFYINEGGVGVGNIGGAAVRLDSTSGQGYFAYLYNGESFRLASWSPLTGLVVLAEVAFAHEPGVYYNIVLEANGTALNAKVWEGNPNIPPGVADDENEPVGWMISTTDLDYSGGTPGIVALGVTDVSFDVFSTGLGGQPYPLGRLPGAPTWVQPVVPFNVPESDPVLTLEWLRPFMTGDVLGGTINYELEYRRESDSGWTYITSTHETLYEWDISRIPNSESLCVRVRAYVGCEYGPWAEICGIGWGGQAPVFETPDGYYFGDDNVGEADHGMWIRLFQASHLDDEYPVHACLVTRELLLAGVGGECLFKKLYVNLTYSTGGQLVVTPILDGERVTEETRFISLDPGGANITRRWEIDLTRGYDVAGTERFRYGLRGSYFQVEICVTDIQGVGRIEIDGIELVYTPARETHAWARPFYGELETDVQPDIEAGYFFGTGTEDVEAAIYELVTNGADFGRELRIRIEPRAFAPFGTAAEALFRTLYLCVTRSNTTDSQLKITPIIDGTELEAEYVTLTATQRPKTEVLEVPLKISYPSSTLERSTYGIRGLWFTYRLETVGARPNGELSIDGAAVEAARDRETEPGVE